MTTEELLKQAVGLLAHWVYLVDTNGAGWDNWDEGYKNAAYRVGGTLGTMINAERERIRKMYAGEE